MIDDEQMYCITEEHNKCTRHFMSEITYASNSTVIFLNYLLNFHSIKWIGIWQTWAISTHANSNYTK